MAHWLKDKLGVVTWCNVKIYGLKGNLGDTYWAASTHSSEISWEIVNGSRDMVSLIWK